MIKFDYKTNKCLSYIWLAFTVVSTCCTFMTGAWHQLLIACASFIMFLAMRPKKWVHIPDEAYSELNKQIENAIAEIEDRAKTVIVEAEFDEATVSLAVELNAKVTTIPFSDDAWGYPKRFTETNFYCSVEIVEIKVTDVDGREIDSDFDENYIQSEYESTDWR